VDHSNFSLFREVSEIDKEINKKYRKLDKFNQKKQEMNDILESCSKYNSLKFPCPDENYNNMNFRFNNENERSERSERTKLQSTRDSTDFRRENNLIKPSKITKMKTKVSNKKLGADYNQQLYCESSRRRPSYKLKRDDEVDLIQHSRKALARSELIEQSIDTTIKSEISTQTESRPSFWGNIFGYFKCAS